MIWNLRFFKHSTNFALLVIFGSRLFLRSCSSVEVALMFKVGTFVSTSSDFLIDCPHLWQACVWKREGLPSKGTRCYVCFGSLLVILVHFFASCFLPFFGLLRFLMVHVSLCMFDCYWLGHPSMIRHSCPHFGICSRFHGYYIKVYATW